MNVALLWLGMAVAQPLHLIEMSAVEQVDEGQAFPDLVFQNGKLSLSSAPGPRVVHIWAPGCKPCFERMSLLVMLARSYPQISVFLASHGRIDGKSKRQIPKNRPDNVFVVRSTAWSKEQCANKVDVGEAVGVSHTYPMTYLVDENLLLTWRAVGLEEERALVPQIQALVTEPPSAPTSAKRAPTTQ